MLLGRYEYRIDQKSRISMPSKFRKEFQEGLVLTHGSDSCIRVYPTGQWADFERQFDSLSLDEDTRREAREIFSHAWDVELDGQGRIALPTDLLERANIDITKSVMIIGASKCVEIWSKELWATETGLFGKQGPSN